AFLPLLVLVAGQSLPIPIPESTSIHLHVAKGGHWTIKEVVTLRFRSADQIDDFDEISELLEALQEDFKSKKAVCDGQVTAAGENRYTFVVTCKGDDVVELLEMLEEYLGLERCAFSWDRTCLRIGGFPPKNEPSLFGAIVGAIVSSMIFGDAKVECKEEFVLTTDGRFVAENLPSKIDDDGRRLVLDLANLYAFPEQERTMRIEGLEE
ncbi:MAG TPA: hypothetical protein VND64_15585, partial [Pirellulales bacterium]|nr:hypothetical protein [Pirellulales bacterium]